MKIIQTKVYTFDELNKKAQQKAIKWFNETNDMPFLPDYMYNEARKLLKENKIQTDDFKVFYSLNYCQGDGAMIELTGKWKRSYITVKHSGHYHHERSTTINIENNPEKEKHFEEEVYIPMCLKLKKRGYKYIENELDPQNTAETIRLEEYTFTEDGTRFG